MSVVGNDTKSELMADDFRENVATNPEIWCKSCPRLSHDLYDVLIYSEENLPKYPYIYSIRYMNTHHTEGYFTSYSQQINSLRPSDAYMRQ